MKKTLISIVLLTALFISCGLNISAGPNGIIANDPITVRQATPIIDASITEGEGWSEAAVMDYDTLGFFWYVNPLTMRADVRYAWDSEYFYYCADITEGLEATHEITGDIIPAGTNGFIYSTGEDDIDIRDNGSGFGYNGDVFGIFIDPMGKFLEYGYTGNEDYTPWYLVGLFEGDSARMYREEIRSGDITHEVNVMGKATEKGWCFEAAIPWDMIITDIEDMVYGEFSIDKDELLSEGAFVRTAAMYHDRFYDAEAEEIATWGCFVTVPETLPDGTPGHMGTGTHAMSLGIILNYEGEATSENEVVETTWHPVTTSPDEVTDITTVPSQIQQEEVPGTTVTSEPDDPQTDIPDSSKKEDSDRPSSPNTTKAPVTSKPDPSGNSSAQTLDITIVTAIAALAISGIGIGCSKKRV